MNQPVKYRHESGCPSRDDLQALLMGSLGDLHEQSIESHVATCEKCGQTLEDLCQNDDVDRWQKLAQDSSDSFTETPAKHSGNKKSSRTDLDNAPAIDGYEMLEVAGRGGMGIVYKARQKSLNRIVAIKTLHSNAPDDWQRIERFKKEADSIARIKHANVVSIYEINDHDGAPYLVLEYIDGPDLGRLIKRQAPFDNFSAAQLVYKLAIAIDAAHRQGLLHRDLKPANILLQVSENCPGDHIRLKDCEPKVTDFGLAKNFEYDDKTRTSMLVGTPGYMAPEQISCPDDWAKPTIDVYALGVILYEMLTGKVPFQANSTFELFKKIELQEPVSIRSLNRSAAMDLEAICLKCLEKKPAKRYQTTNALADDLSRFLRREPIVARRVSFFNRWQRWALRNQLQLALVGALFGGVMVFGVLLFNVQRQNKIALDNYETNMRQSLQLFEKAKQSNISDFTVWDQAAQQAQRALAIKTQYPNLIADDGSDNIAGVIDYHRSARALISDLDEALFQLRFVNDRGSARENWDNRSDTALDTFGLRPESGMLEETAMRLRSLDETTREGIVTVLYRILLNRTNLDERDWYEQLASELDVSQWRRSAYQSCRVGDLDSALALMTEPDLRISADSLAEFASGLNSSAGVNPKQIVNYLKLCYQKYPSSFWLNSQLTYFIRRSDNPKHAIPYMRAALAQRETSEVRLKLGRLYREIVRLDEAETEFLAVYESDPENKEVCSLLAECYLRQKKYSQAIEFFKRSIQRNPTQDFVRGRLLSTYFAAGMPEEAIEYANELTSRDTTDHETYHTKAVAYAKLGKLEESIANYHFAIEADPDCLICLLDLAKAYRQQGNLLAAKEQLEVLLEQRPNIVTVLELMMNVCTELEDWETAIEYGKRRVDISPTTPHFRTELAEVYIAAQQYELAEDAYLKAQTYARKDVAPLEHLSIMYQKQGKLELAESALKRAMLINAKFGPAHNQLVTVLIQRDKIDEALEIARQFAKSNPHSIDGYAALMKALTKTGDYTAAIEAFENGRRLDGDPPKHFHQKLFDRLKELESRQRDDS